MKIALLANASKLHAVRWANGLAARGHDVRLLSDEQPSPLLAPGIEVRHPQWNAVRKFLAFKVRGGPYANNREKWTAYLPEVRAMQPDVVHAMEALAYGPMLMQCESWPRVLTPWGPDVEGLDGSDPERDRLVHTALRNAEVVATNAPGLEESWAERTELDPSLFYFFAWGVDAPFLATRNEAMERRLIERCGLAPHKTLVLSPRIARKEYRPATILEAWRVLRPEKAQLVMLRAGAPEDEWNALQQGAPADVRFIDEWLTPPEMAALYAMSRATVSVPTTDLLALSILEAMACGSVPVVAPLKVYASAVTGLYEETRHRGRGYVLPETDADALADGMARVLELSADEHATIAKHNRAVVARHFVFERSVEHMEEAYALAGKRHAESREGK